VISKARELCSTGVLRFRPRPHERAPSSAIVTWNLTHRYCGRCGGTTTSSSAGWKRTCDQCKTEHFPRADPVVIMLVTHSERCLVARQARWPARQISALAGFIEPGETPEDAVRREVFEEVGLRIGVVHYLGAQPWPFPLSLMLGFQCESQSLDIHVDASEIERAIWLTQSEARTVLEGTHPEVRAPGPYAIAHHLLRAWAFR
jgi:NAD+ diphosphatase